MGSYLCHVISEDLKLFPTENQIIISFDEINDNYKNVLSKIKNFIGGDIEYRKNSIEPAIRSSRRKQNDQDTELFQKFHQKLDWEKIKVE